MNVSLKPWFLIVGMAIALASLHAKADEYSGYSSSSVAREKQLPKERTSSTQFALEFGTQAPLWAGLNGRLHIQRHFAIEAGFGFMPSPYASMIGQTTSYYTGTTIYRTLIENGFQSSRIFQLGARYQVTGAYGWHFGANSYFLRSQGSVSLDQVLMSQGYNPSMVGGYGSYLAMISSADLMLLSASLGYTWKLGEQWGLDASLGIAKIVNSNVRLNTSVPQFDQSTMGQMVLAQAANQVQQTLNAYGVTPLLGVSVQYLF